MNKRVLLLLLSVLLTTGFAFAATACTNASDEDFNIIEAFIDENREVLYGISADHLADLGEGASVDFLAEDHEFIYVYTFGEGFSAEEVQEFVTGLLNFSENVDMYQTLARDLAQTIGLEYLVVTVRYYDSDGEYINSASYFSHPEIIESAEEDADSENE